MIQIYKRSIGMCILLSIVTCGIYGIYWMYLLVKNTRSIQKNTDSCKGEMLCLIFVPFYSLYWWYTRGEKVRQGFAEHDYNATGGGVVYLVLAFFGLSIVSMAIMQSNFNSLKSETHSEQRSTSEGEGVVKRFIVPVLAICASAFMAFAAIYSHGIQPYLAAQKEGKFSCPVLFYLIVFAVIMGIGMLCNVKNKGEEKPISFKSATKKQRRYGKKKK